MSDPSGSPLPSLGSATASRLLRLLEDDGWHREGGREGLYLRLAPPRPGVVDSRSLVIPLDTSAPDYMPLLEDAVRSLAASPETNLGLSLLRRLTTAPADEFRFSKETNAPAGWIDWTSGEELIKSARAVLATGAKTARQRMRYYGNRFGQFAGRFIDEVLMGQTAIGSYVVRAYVPTDSLIPLRGGAAAEGAHFEGMDSVSARSVSLAAAEVLSATTEALDHYRTRGSLSGFTDSDLPVSYEAVTAIQGLADNADLAVIRVSWDPEGSERPGGSEDYEFSARDVPVLERAAHSLVQPEPEREVAASGTVHLLSRTEAAGPGVIGLTTAERPVRRLRVRLDEEDYHRAIEAHDRGLGITVVGDLEREGNMSWLYRARILGVSESTGSSEPPTPARLSDVLEGPADEPMF